MRSVNDDLRSDFLLEVRNAIVQKKNVVLMMYNSEDGDWCVMSPGEETGWNALLEPLCKLPFLGRIQPKDAFGMWEEYYEDVALANIYGFELDDGLVQVSIVD
jgi:hypothetical protein